MAVDHATEERQRWMAVLARAGREELETLSALLDAGDGTPRYHLPRPVETGLAMVRGRMGGTGRAFNLGEMTISRCVVQLEDNTTGVAYIRGRDRRKAELAAVLDACLQSGLLEPSALREMTRAQEEAAARRSRAVAGTKVDFFTMVRGED
ncbi:MAG: phosphonate C-P lyase system protein PhnG [Gammaproteobacteria bacterium]